MLIAKCRTPIFVRLVRQVKLYVLLFLFSLSLLPTMVNAEISRPDPSGRPTAVMVDIYILDLDEVNTASQSFDANVFVELSWQDPRLVHNEASALTRKLGDIWSPRVQIANLQRSWKTFDEIVKVNSDGTVIYAQRYWGSFSQPLRLKDFPFDSQNFNIQLMSVEFSPEEVQFVPGPQNGIAEDLSVVDWSVTSFKSSTKPFTVSTSKTPLASLTAIIEAERKSNYFWLKVILPLVLIVMMSWVVFWIDPQEGSTQISVAITSMLTLIAYRFAISTDIPKISYMTRLDLFVLGSTILVFTGLVEVLITSTYTKIGQIEKARRIDIWSRVLFPVAFVVLTLQSLFDVF